MNYHDTASTVDNVTGIFQLEPGDMISFAPDTTLSSSPKWAGVFIFVGSYAGDGYDDWRWYQFIGPTGQLQTIGPYYNVEVLQRIKDCTG